LFVYLSSLFIWSPNPTLSQMVNLCKKGKLYKKICFLKFLVYYYIDWNYFSWLNRNALIKDFILKLLSFCTFSFGPCVCCLLEILITPLVSSNSSYLNSMKYAIQHISWLNRNALIKDFILKLYMLFYNWYMYVT
jgi:hypothetical protein